MNRNTHLSNRLSRMLLAFCAFGVMPLAAADGASDYLQPPILGWHELPKVVVPAAAAPVAPVASVAATPAAPAAPAAALPARAPVVPPAPLPPAPALPPPATEAVVPPVIHSAAVANTSPPPAPPVARRQSAVQRLLAFQSEAEDPGTFQPILGVEAQQSFKNYLKSFTGGSGSTSSSSTKNAGSSVALQGMSNGQSGGNASGY